MGTVALGDRTLCTHSLLGVLGAGLLVATALLVDGALFTDWGLFDGAGLFALLSRLRAFTSALLSSLSGRRRCSSPSPSSSVVRPSVLAGAEAGLDVASCMGVSVRCAMRLGVVCRLACVVSLAEEAVLPYHCGEPMGGTVVS